MSPVSYSEVLPFLKTSHAKTGATAIIPRGVEYTTRSYEQTTGDGDGDGRVKQGIKENLVAPIGSSTLFLQLCAFVGSCAVCADSV